MRRYLTGTDAMTDEMTTPAVIDCEDDLRSLYGEPGDMAVRKCIGQLDEHCRAFIALSPFLALGTSRPGRGADVSPRGDAPGFVIVLDERTLAIPDRPGNNRLDSASNVVANPEVALLFLIPGIDETLRVNGTAHITTDPDLLARMEVQGKRPKSAMVVEVREAMLHCAKAFRRSRLWSGDYRQARSVLPGLARMIRDQTGATYDVEKAEAGLEESYRRTMW
jgi:PPOX class probable FMN-dependent enzyme